MPLLRVEKGHGWTDDRGPPHTISPFQKEGSAVSGETRRLQAVRIFPWKDVQLGER
jgi:hypothetical protein